LKLYKSSNSYTVMYNTPLHYTPRMATALPKQYPPFLQFRIQPMQ